VSASFANSCASMVLRRGGDAHPSLQPVVVWKRNAAPWRVFCDAHHYLGQWQRIFRLEQELSQMQNALDEARMKAGGT